MVPLNSALGFFMFGEPTATFLKSGACAGGPPGDRGLPLDPWSCLSLHAQRPYPAAPWTFLDTQPCRLGSTALVSSPAAPSWQTLSVLTPPTDFFSRHLIPAAFPDPRNTW